MLSKGVQVPVGVRFGQTFPSRPSPFRNRGMRSIRRCSPGSFGSRRREASDASIESIGI